MVESTVKKATKKKATSKITKKKKGETEKDAPDVFKVLALFWSSLTGHSV